MSHRFINTMQTIMCLFLHLAVVLSCFDCYASAFLISTVDELESALDKAQPGDTILLQDGIYKIPSTNWAIQITTEHLTIRSQSGNRDAVIIEGLGMDARRHHGFFVQASNTTIADLTIRNVRNHCVQTSPGVDWLHIKNCVLRDAGEQIVKVPTDAQKDPAEFGIIEGCIFEYSAGIGPRYYIGGIDVHNGKDWIIRDNVFRFIRSPKTHIAEHAIHFWNNSMNTLVERNKIINCDRGIGFGMEGKGHLGGMIRSNLIVHDGTPGFNDVGIILESSPDTQIRNNEIYLNHDYPNAIECRFPTSQNILIINNKTNKAIQMRNGATAQLKNNNTSEKPDCFSDGPNEFKKTIADIAGQ